MRLLLRRGGQEEAVALLMAAEAGVAIFRSDEEGAGAGLAGAGAGLAIAAGGEGAGE